MIVIVAVEVPDAKYKPSTRMNIGVLIVVDIVLQNIYGDLIRSGIGSKTG